MNHTKKWIIGIIAVTVVLVASTAAVNPQTPPAATGVTVTNITNGVRVSWNDDSAAVHRVGWAHDGEVQAANAAGDWLEAFHFADTKRNTDYTIKYLPDGQKYWVIVGAANSRFGAAAWSNWSSLTVRTAAISTPAPTPTQTATPRPTVTPRPTPTPEPTATPQLTATQVPTQSVNNGDWTYFGPNCPAAYANCASTAYDGQFISLSSYNHTNEDFYDDPSIRVSCTGGEVGFTFDGGGPWIALGETGMSIRVGNDARTWFWTDRGSSSLESVWFNRDDSLAIIGIISDGDSRGEPLHIGASSDYGTVVADFKPTGFQTNYERLSCANS